MSFDRLGPEAMLEPAIYGRKFKLRSSQIALSRHASDKANYDNQAAILRDIDRTAQSLGFD